MHKKNSKKCIICKTQKMIWSDFGTTRGKVNSYCKTCYRELLLPYKGTKLKKDTIIRERKFLFKNGDETAIKVYKISMTIPEHKKEIKHYLLKTDEINYADGTPRTPDEKREFRMKLLEILDNYHKAYCEMGLLCTDSMNPT